ncbi:MAG: 2'-5' RNA ligase family protein [Ferrovibrio sp.]|uniref:2'-5' RNA ligase family protein n=1 Tax=Ferrovibrio sp. TaxID=1917215 RepID=UPI0039187420
MYAVIAIPEFSPSDAAWIDAIRQSHDPQHARVAAHVTLSFPHRPADAAWFAGHVESVAAVTAPFDVAFDRLERMDDPFNPKYRHLAVLLADDVSAAPLTALYRALGGEGEYRPHVTLARFGAVFSAKALLRQIGEMQQPLRGRIAALELLNLENGAIRIEATLPLRG